MLVYGIGIENWKYLTSICVLIQNTCFKYFFKEFSFEYRIRIGYGILIHYLKWLTCNCIQIPTQIQHFYVMDYSKRIIDWYWIQILNTLWNTDCTFKYSFMQTLIHGIWMKYLDLFTVPNSKCTFKKLFIRIKIQYYGIWKKYLNTQLVFVFKHFFKVFLTSLLQTHLPQR